MATKIKRLICLAAASLLVLLIFPFSASAEESVNGVIEALINSQNEEFDGEDLLGGSLSDLAGNTDYDWIALGAARYGASQGGEIYLKRLAEKLPEKGSANATNLHRTALVTAALGGDPRNIGGRNLIAEGIFNCDTLGAQGVNGYIWALITLDSMGYEIPEDSEISRESLISSILSGMKNNGSFTLNGKLPDTDITAMALTALAPYYGSERIYEFTNADGSESAFSIEEAVDLSLTWLSEVQMTDGGFSVWGTENCETTAQVIIALCSLGIDINTDGRFIKEGNTVFDGLMKYRTDGGFAHIIDESGEGQTNALATGQALCALTAIYRTEKGYGSFYDLTGEFMPDSTVSDSSTSGSESENSPNESAEEISESSFKLKPKFALTALAVAAGIIILFVIAHKVSRKKDIFIILLIVAVVITIILRSDFQSVEDFYNVQSESTEGSLSVRIAISCAQAIEKEEFKASLIEDGYIPGDGIILSEVEYSFNEGESAFDILLKAVKENRIQMEYQGADDNGLGTVYIEGISYLYELDCGPESGWMYKVNGESPNYGISQYSPENGDIIEIYYVTDYTEE